MTAETILIVDDNLINLKFMRVLLTGEGYDVRTAANAEQALSLVQTTCPGLVLMDLQLPGMDGLALTRRLKRDPRTRGAIVIAVTAYAMKGDEEKARDAGCDDYVAKPVDTRTLPALIARHLAAAREAKP